MNTGRKKKCWERNLSQCSVICRNYHIDCPGLEANYLQVLEVGQVSVCFNKTLLSNRIFKAGMGVITKLLNMVDQNVVKEGTVDAKSKQFSLF